MKAQPHSIDTPSGLEECQQGVVALCTAIHELGKRRVRFVVPDGFRKHIPDPRGPFGSVPAPDPVADALYGLHAQPLDIKCTRLHDALVTPAEALIERLRRPEFRAVARAYADAVMALIGGGGRPSVDGRVWALAARSLGYTNEDGYYLEQIEPAGLAAFDGCRAADLRLATGLIRLAAAFLREQGLQESATGEFMARLAPRALDELAMPDQGNAMQRSQDPSCDMLQLLNELDHEAQVRGGAEAMLAAAKAAMPAEPCEGNALVRRPRVEL